MQSVQERISELEELFSRLCGNIGADLKITSYFKDLQILHMMEMSQIESMDDFFAFIKQNWSWLNHELLGMVVNAHCSDELKGELKEYADKVNKFRHEVTIHEMMEYFSGLPMLEPPSEFSVLRVKMDYDPQACVLARVYDICQQLCVLTKLPVSLELLPFKKCQLEADALYAVWFMPKVLRLQFRNTIDQLDIDVWRKQQVLKLAVDETVLCPASLKSRVEPKVKLKMVEDNLKLQPIFGDGTDETAHEILVSLEKRSHFSVDNIQPLEDLLMNLHRDDLIVKCLIPFKHKYKSEKTTALSERDDLNGTTTKQLEDNQRTLDLSNKCIGDDGFKCLLEGYPTYFEILDLSGNHIGDEGVEELIWFLCKCPSLQTLNLSDNQIGDKGAGSLSWGIRECPSLHTLNLSGNQIGDEGVESLSWGLRVCSNLQTLTTLNLSGNQIGDNGAWRLALDLKECDNLRTLNLRGNQISDEGALYLGEGLGRCRSLQTLNLSDNNVSDDGAINIIASHSSVTLILYGSDAMLSDLEVVFPTVPTAQAPIQTVMESDLSGIDLAQGNHHDHSEQPYRISDSK